MAQVISVAELAIDGVSVKVIAAPALVVAALVPVITPLGLIATVGVSAVVVGPVAGMFPEVSCPVEQFASEPNVCAHIATSVFSDVMSDSVPAALARLV